MHFKVLGRLTVADGDRQFALESHKQRSLLALLLINGGAVVSTDQIIDELWGDATESNRQPALWVHVSNLRSTLEPEREARTEGTLIRTRSPGYLIDLHDHEVDAVRFEELVGEGRGLLSEYPDKAAAVLRNALELWHGTAYEDFIYEPFAQAEIARLDELRLQAVEARVDADLATGLSSELVPELETLTRQHPLRERVTAQLMTALYRAGRRAEALRTYEAARKRLAEELGIDPSPDLHELERQVLQDDPALLRDQNGHILVRGAQRGFGVRSYELRRPITTTEVGTVYQAYQPTVGREVVITHIDTEIADSLDFIRHANRRFQQISSMAHPHIVPVSDFWREPGAAYLVNPRYSGEPLLARLTSGPLPEADLARMVGEIGAALSAAHERGLVHGRLDAEAVICDDRGSFLLAGLDLSVAANMQPGRQAPEVTVADDIACFADIIAQAIAGTTTSRGDSNRPVPADVAEVLRRAEDPPPNTTINDLVDALFQAFERAATGPSAAAGDNPYRGLAPFSAADHDLFHGRQRVIDRLLARLVSSGPAGRLIALVGPSGSGKSSVVRAGLLPALASGAIPGSEDWFVTTATPDNRPFESLEAALLRIAIAPPNDLLERLQADDSGLRRLVRRILPDDGSKLLLVIDQFEELFTVAEPDTARRFLDSIVSAVEDNNAGLRVLVTLRADFYDGPLRHRRLGELLRNGTEAITPMSAAELEAAITEPARNAGVELEPALVAEMIRQVVDQPGALPLLQYALTELFDQRTGSKMTLVGYERIGGVLGALASSADAAVESGTEIEQRAIRQVFLRLVTLGDGASDTRRRVLVSELTDLPFPPGTINDVLDRFSDLRLLTSDRDPVSRSPTIEISHEALLTEWQRLGGWIDDARDTVRPLRRLRSAMIDWIEADRADDHLLSGGALDRIAATVDNDEHVEIGQAEYAYLTASLAQREYERREADAREQRLSEAQRKARRRLRMTVVGTVVGIGLAVLGTAAVLQRRAALESERQLATTLTARQLAAASRIELSRNPPLATRLALEAALQTAESGFVTPEALDALHWAIQQSNVVYPADATTPVAVRPGPAGSVGVFALTPNDVIEMALSTDPPPLSTVGCSRYLGTGDCSTGAPVFPGGLEIQGGEEAYGVVPPGPGALDGTSVEIHTAFDTVDSGLPAELEQFQDETGIRVLSPHVPVGPELSRRLSVGQTLPDVSFWPQPAGLIRFGGDEAIDLTGYLDDERLRSDFGNTLLSLGTVAADGSWPASSGALRGLVGDVDVKGLVFYPRAEFEASGYEIPTSWDELITLSDQMVADGRTPWCFHFHEDDVYAGWPGTDLIETLVIREGGPDLYDAWTRHEVPFNHPTIRRAARRAETLLLTEGYARGGAQAISRLNWFREGAEPLLTQEPQCWLLPAGDLHYRLIAGPHQIGVDVDSFPFPPIEAGDTLPAIGGGNLASVFADRPEVRQFVEHFASPDWGAEWAAQNFGEFLSPNQRFDVTGYGADGGSEAVATLQAIGTANRDALAAGTWRFDASDLMPPSIGSADGSQRGAFLQGMLDVVDGVTTMDQMLDDVEQEWQQLEAASGDDP